MTRRAQSLGPLSAQSRCNLGAIRVQHMGNLGPISSQSRPNLRPILAPHLRSLASPNGTVTSSAARSILSAACSSHDFMRARAGVATGDVSAPMRPAADTELPATSAWLASGERSLERRSDRRGGPGCWPGCCSRDGQCSRDGRCSRLCRGWACWACWACWDASACASIVHVTPIGTHWVRT